MENKLILGTVQFGLNYGVNNFKGKPKKKDVFNILKFAYDSGVKFLDTAQVYGNAHQLIGDFHQNYSNLKFKIITKLPNEIKHNIIKRNILDYLDLMRIDTLEVIMFHSYDSFRSNYSSLKLLNELKSGGLINNIGVSVYTNTQLESLLNEDLINVVQLPLNLLDNLSIKGDLIYRLKKKEKIIHTRSTFLQGLFFKEINDKNIIVSKLSNELMILNGIKSKLNCSMEDLALSYCINQEFVDKVIIGVDSVDHLKSNLKAMSYKLPLEIISDIDEIKVKDLRLLNPSLWN